MAFFLCYPILFFSFVYMYFYRLKFIVKNENENWLVS